MELPSFVYHADPLATGSIVKSNNECVCCHQRKGYIYTGPVYAVEELIDCICPWCIADGSAHKKYNAEFVDASGIGGYGSWEPVSPSVRQEVAFRTPGFSGWQQERWWTHCADAAIFLGLVGWPEIQKFGDEAIAVFVEEAESLGYGLHGQTYVRSLDKKGGPTGYLFRCRHCHKLGGYSDCH